MIENGKHGHFMCLRDCHWDFLCRRVFRKPTRIALGLIGPANMASRLRSPTACGFHLARSTIPPAAVFEFPLLLEWSREKRSVTDSDKGLLTFV